MRDCVETHDSVVTENFEKLGAFAFGVTRRGDLLEGGFEALGLRGERVDECEAAAKSKLNIGIVRDHVVYEFDDSGVVCAGGFVAWNDDFG